ncbi:hypothetical protein [Streptomyces sp. 5-10]|uniref:hypothetical protein n=1 Tax=Streptomyces sp. 5-10 TaxID=878925 RepID=UPI00168AF5AF|nr:hypothetical protein [Streptomyces sp. 5-10]MBD3004726.1 hypothetical protein [Streptomyces sp. 5-10]
MIEDIGRCVMQRVTFTGPHTFTRHGAGMHGEKIISDESVTPRGVYEAVNRMGLKPGEVVAVWNVLPDEDRENVQIEQDLPPVPTILLVRTADKRLLELNPAYLAIHDQPSDYG